MSIAAQPLTYAALRALPDLGERYELIDGAVTVPPAPTTLHQRLLTRLSDVFLDAVRPLGQRDYLFYAPYDVVFSLNRVVQPDLVYVTPARASIVTEDAIVGAPDLVLEILSPSSRVRDEGRKRRLYAEASVPEYWLVDPVARAVTLFTLDAGDYRAAVATSDPLRSGVLPGLEIDPVALFAGL